MRNWKKGASLRKGAAATGTLQGWLDEPQAGAVATLVAASAIANAITDGNPELVDEVLDYKTGCGALADTSADDRCDA